MSRQVKVVSSIQIYKSEMFTFYMSGLTARGGVKMTEVNYYLKYGMERHGKVSNGHLLFALHSIYDCWLVFKLTGEG